MHPFNGTFHLNVSKLWKYSIFLPYDHSAMWNSLHFHLLSVWHNFLFLSSGQLAAGTCEIVTLDRDSSQPRRTIARQTARCACKKGQIAGTTRARPACVDGMSQDPPPSFTFRESPPKHRDWEGLRKLPSRASLGHHPLCIPRTISDVVDYSVISVEVVQESRMGMECCISISSPAVLDLVAIWGGLESSYCLHRELSLSVGIPLYLYYFGRSIKLKYLLFICAIPTKMIWQKPSKSS